VLGFKGLRIYTALNIQKHCLCKQCCCCYSYRNNTSACMVSADHFSLFVFFSCILRWPWRSNQSTHNILHKNFPYWTSLNISWVLHTDLYWKRTDIRSQISIR